MASFLKPEACGQTELPDRSVLIRQKLVENAKIENSNATFWVVTVFENYSKKSHFQGGEKARPDLQARVWNLLNKGKIFEKMVQHPTLLNITRSLIGN